MIHPRVFFCPRPAAPRPLALALAAVLLFGAAVATAFAARDDPGSTGATLPVLPAAHAVGVRTDTAFLGGYARGSFTEALATVGGALSPGERQMIGRHLDRIFPDLLAGKGLGSGGRLRLAYERVSRPDGSTRSVRVLAAEAAAHGELHSAFFFEEGDRPGYFDARGRSLAERPWTGPLPFLRVTSPFGLRRLHPILRRVLPHTGTDYAAAAGSPVRATGDGSVSFAGSRGGYGNLVEIQHPNGYATRYAHLARIAAGVRPDAVVRQGEIIGYVGMTGLATAPHLHYEVRERGRPVDPAGVAALGGPVADLATDAEWRRERVRLGQLLAAAPRVLSRR